MRRFSQPSAGEDARTALARELHEELAVHVHDAEPLMAYRVSYPDREVLLDMWVVNAWHGEVEGREGQACKWIEPSALDREDILEADQPIVAALAARSPRR